MGTDLSSDQSGGATVQCVPGGIAFDFNSAIALSMIANFSRDFLMLTAILSCSKIPLRTSSNRLDVDGVQLQFSPGLCISVHHHVGFLRQIKELCGSHGFNQSADICWSDLAFSGW